MSNISTEKDYAKVILKTYHQVHDTPYTRKAGQRSRRLEKAKHLENELQALKEKYVQLQNELHTRDERLARLNRLLDDQTTHITQLHEDFEHAIYQLGKKPSL